MPTAFTGPANIREESPADIAMGSNTLTRCQLLQPCEAPHLFKYCGQTHGNKRTKVKVPACSQYLLQGRA